MYYKNYIVYLSFMGFGKDLRDNSLFISSNQTTVYRIWLCFSPFPQPNAGAQVTDIHCHIENY